MSFTPETALLGGLTLGAAAAAKFLLTGRILGISGAVKGLVIGDLAPWRLLFLMGMMAGSLVAAAQMPQVFVAFPASVSVRSNLYTASRIAAAGLLVGLGTSMGNGCTSVSFMIAGMLTAKLTSLAGALQLAPQAALYAAPSAASVASGATLAACCVASMTAVAVIARFAPVVADGLAEAVSGFFFAMGLALSGLVMAAKVAAFLSISHPAWDASLLLVMGGALLVAAPAFQAASRFMSQPACGSEFQLGLAIFASRLSAGSIKACLADAPPSTAGEQGAPKTSVIDGWLVTGGLLFGTGWGLLGVCPGPAIVNLGGSLMNSAARDSFLLWLGAMALGILIDQKLLNRSLMPSSFRYPPRPASD